MKRLLNLAALYLVACGGGTDGKPVAPPTTLAPAPEPAPPPERPGRPTGVRVVEVGRTFIVWAWDPVEGATGYQGHAFPAGTPPNERPPFRDTVEPTLREEGLELGARMGFFVRAIRETASGRAAGPWSSQTVAETWEEPRVCTDEREQALAFGAILIDEWNGTPFRFYFDRDSVPEDERGDVEYMFETVERLSAKIENQLGYSTVEVGGWISQGVPCRDGGERGRQQIVAFVSPETERGTNLVTASPRCADVQYYGATMRGRRDGTIVHEIFHLFGFAHSPDVLVRTGTPHHSQSPPGVGYPMTTTLTGDYPESGEVPATYSDIDALRCIFPEGG